MQTVNLLLCAGGFCLYIGTCVWTVRLSEQYQAQGFHADGDVLRGPAIALLTTTATTGLAATAFLLLKHGYSWGCFVDVAVWAVWWFPGGIYGGFAVATLICIAGSVLALARFLLSTGRDLPTGEVL